MRGLATCRESRLADLRQIILDTLETTGVVMTLMIGTITLWPPLTPWLPSLVLGR